MEVIIAFVAVFVLLMFSVYKGIFILYPLLFGFAVFVVIALRRGHKAGALLMSVLKSFKKSLLIINILILIGAITAVWRASGTVAYIVYYGIQLIHPKLFVLSAFLLCCLISFLLGTSFGTIGTVGMILMIMVKGSNISLNMVAGAVIAGAYFGDRCSPMSSSANLVAAVTDTELYKNIRNMFATSAVPMGLSIIIYGILSVRNPVYMAGSGIGQELTASFNLSGWVILPALVILILAVFKVDVKVSMLVSILLGAGIAILVQHNTMIEVLTYILTGYRMEGGGLLSEIIKGGGIASMVKVTLIILVSFAISGIFEATDILKEAEQRMEQLGKKLSTFGTMIVTGIFSASFGCSQTLAIMLVYQLVNKLYERTGKDKYELAVDIENTVIVISALIPWNIAGAVPAAALSVDAGFIPYAFYLYLLPLCSLVMRQWAIGNRQ